MAKLNGGPRSGFSRRKILKGAGVMAGAALGSTVGAPMIWAQNNKNIVLRQFGTGVSNLNEFLAGTGPTNAASALRLRLQPTGQGFFLNWNTQPGLIYQVQVSTNLKSWSSLPGMRFAPGTVDSMFVGSSPASYYRVLRVR